MKDSFSVLKTSSMSVFFNRRLIHNPATRRRIYPVVRVNIYRLAFASKGKGSTSIHQFRKKNRKPKNKHTYILFQVIFSFLTPLVPKQDKARKTTQNSFVHRRLENNHAVCWKFSNIRSITPILIPHLTIQL